MKKVFLLGCIVILAACNPKKSNESAAAAKENATNAVEAIPGVATSAAASAATAVADKAKMAADELKKMVKADTFCYEFHLKKDVNSIQLIVAGDDVTGTMDYIPYEKDSAHGTLKGKKKGNEIVADWNVMMEGNKQTEEVRLKMDGEKLLRAGGALAERGGKMVLKDPATAKYAESFTKVSCKVYNDKRK